LFAKIAMAIWFQVSGFKVSGFRFQVSGFKVSGVSPAAGGAGLIKKET
jgi:hypothetical protein